MARRRHSSRWQEDPKPAQATPRATGQGRIPSSQLPRVAANVQAILNRISQKPSASVKPAVRPAASSVVLHSRKYGDAPEALVRASEARISNNPSTMGQIKLIQKVVRTMESKGEVLSHVQNKNAPRAGMTHQGLVSLRGKGVSEKSERSNHACLSEHRPDPTPKGGGGSNREFVHWCKKGDGKK